MNYAEYKECKIDSMLKLTSLYTFSNRKFCAGYYYKGESHDFYEAVIVSDGKAGITADKNIYALSAGQMIIHPCNEFHNLWADETHECAVIIFSFSADVFPKLKSSIFNLTAEELSQIKDIYNGSFGAFVRNGVHIVSVKDPMRANMTVVRLELFLLNILSENRSENRKKHGKSSKNYFHILSVMEENLSANLTNTEMAELSNMSVAGLEKTVKKYSGYGAKAYYNILKMQKARELLQSGASVKEAAYAVGFADQNYFSARYKKWAGVSPTRDI